MVLSDLSRRSTWPAFFDKSQGLKIFPNWQSISSEFAKKLNGFGREKIEREAPCIIRLSSANEPPWQLLSVNIKDGKTDGIIGKIGNIQVGYLPVRLMTHAMAATTTLVKWRWKRELAMQEMQTSTLSLPDVQMFFLQSPSDDQIAWFPDVRWQMRASTLLGERELSWVDCTVNKLTKLHFIWCLHDAYFIRQNHLVLNIDVSLQYH